MATPRHFSENRIKAQNFALESHEMDLQMVFSLNKRFLSSCGSIIKKSDQDKILSKRDPVNKASLLKQLMVKHPQKFDQIMNIIRKKRETKYIADIIEHEKVTHEQWISDQEKKDVVLKDLGKCLLGKEISRDFHPNSEISAVIKDLIKSAQTSHPNHEEIETMSMVELQHELILSRKMNDEKEVTLSKLNEEMEDIRRNIEATDREIEKLGGELDNREKWIRCCDAEITQLKTEIEKSKKVKVDKQTSTNDMANGSCQSSQTTPTITCQSPQTTPKVRHSETSTYQTSQNAENPSDINCPHPREAMVSCQDETTTSNNINQTFKDGQFYNLSPSSAVRSPTPAGDSTNVPPAKAEEGCGGLEDGPDIQQSKSKEEMDETEDTVTIIASNLSQDDQGWIADTCSITTSRSNSTISIRSASKDFQESNINCQHGHKCKMVIHKHTTIRCKNVYYTECNHGNRN